MARGAYGVGPADRPRDWFPSTVRPISDTARRLVGIANGVDPEEDEVPGNGG